MERFIVLLCAVTQLTRSYFIGPNELTWDDGQAYCESEGSNLASIHSAEELQEVATLCLTHVSGSDCHIGMYEDQNDLKWKWIDGSASDYGFNIDGTPNGNVPPWEGSWAYSGSPQCQKIDVKNEGTGFFDDTGCGGSNPPICNGEMCNDNRVGDACANDDECPACMQCCPKRKKCEYAPEDRQYVAGVGQLNWQDAQNWCISTYGTGLATIITDEDLANFLIVFDASVTTVSGWTGLNDIQTEGTWQWADGTDCKLASNLCTDLWGDNQPNEFNGGDQDCVTWWPNGGGKNDFECHYLRNFICNAPAGGVSAKSNMVNLLQSNNELNEMLNGKKQNYYPDEEHAYKNNYNYYGYIILIGVIAFILINNVFIGCWCLGKSQNKEYQKCEVDVINNEI